MNRKEIDMNNDIELKPCPFCGGTNLYYAAGRFYAVECADCGGKVVGTFKTTEEAADAWNTRSQADASQQKLTLKDAICYIVEFLERTKKDILPDRNDSLNFNILHYFTGEIFVSLYSANAHDKWLSDDKGTKVEDIKKLEFSENEIAEYLKAKIKTPAQKIQEEIEYRKEQIAELKAKLARLEKKGIEWKK